MQAKLPKRSRLFEFFVLLAIVGVLGLPLLQALQTLQDDSERLAVNLTIRNMNTGLTLQQAELVAAGRENALRELAEQNPVTWLGSFPDGYIGEQSCAGVLAAGQWCWDKTQRVLYYYPKQENWIKNARRVPWLTWRVVAPQHTSVFRPGSFRLQAEGDAARQGL